MKWSLLDYIRIPKAHRRIVENTVVGYPWFSNLRAKYVFKGYETESGDIETFWLFLWDEPKNKVHDVAACGTLRVNKQGVFSWEMARMDGGDGGLRLIVKVYDHVYTDFFEDAEKGYRAISGAIKK